MTEQNRIQIARNVVDAFNANDWEQTKQLLGDSVYKELGTQRQLTGADQIIPAVQGWKQAMPDVKGTVTTAFASGNQVTLEVTWEGTHTGPLVGATGTIPASGKH
ncbi:ester cyclase [Candidatus Poribacteria bacterium]|nr:ester cyclase [Candidatus Poribacteria bacterium]